LLLSFFSKHGINVLYQQLTNRYDDVKISFNHSIMICDGKKIITFNSNKASWIIQHTKNNNHSHSTEWINEKNKNLLLRVRYRKLPELIQSNQFLFRYVLRGKKRLLESRFARKYFDYLSLTYFLWKKDVIVVPIAYSFVCYNVHYSSKLRIITLCWIIYSFHFTKAFYIGKKSINKNSSISMP
jgi:hypothetical protein